MANEFGYSGKILRVDLSSGATGDTPTSDYSDKFLGGRGIAAKIYWDEVPPETRAFDPENRLLFATGPLTGITRLPSPRVHVCGKSPLTTPEQFCWGNFGGSWPTYLKMTGFDGIVVQGKSDRPVYLFLHDGISEIRDASHLWGKGVDETRETLKAELGDTTRVLANGPAGDNMVVFATMQADNDAAGAGGMGAVMGSKKLKAIAVDGSSKIAVASPPKLRDLLQYIKELKVGSATVKPGVKWRFCWGCDGFGCMRRPFNVDESQQGKYACQKQTFYREWTTKYKENRDPTFWPTKTCNDYGLDTNALVPVLPWLSRCAEAGIITDKSTGIPISKIGSQEFIEILVKKVSFREGFGDILAQGLLRAAELLGPVATELIADPSIKAQHSESNESGIWIIPGLLIMVEPRTPWGARHEILNVMLPWQEWAYGKEDAYLTSDVARAIARKFWGSELAVDFSTYEGKAIAAKKIQDRQYAEESLSLCNWTWPIMSTRYTADHAGDPAIESKVLSAVTGKEVEEATLDRIGERVFNLQRAIAVREGHQGREDDDVPESYFTRPLDSALLNPDCLVPGKNGKIISKKGTVVDRDKFEKLKDDYYSLRGWDSVTGRQTAATLNELGLQEVARELEQKGLTAGRHRIASRSSQP